MSKYDCPTCHQDMRAKPHEGMRGENCPQCGQGLFWRVARIHQRANKASTQLVVGSGKKAKSTPKRKPVKSNRQRPAPSG
jgi:predicted RNA-binding Zn-ribbon protein involved in translation (DUF1610 family)